LASGDAGRIRATKALPAQQLTEPAIFIQLPTFLGIPREA
jgi:hypothetical protein